MLLASTPPNVEVKHVPYGWNREKEARMQRRVAEQLAKLRKAEAAQINT